MTHNAIVQHESSDAKHMKDGSTPHAANQDKDAVKKALKETLPCALDKNHSHFFLIDDGRSNGVAAFGPDTELRGWFESCVADASEDKYPVCKLRFEPRAEQYGFWPDDYSEYYFARLPKGTKLEQWTSQIKDLVKEKVGQEMAVKDVKVRIIMKGQDKDGDYEEVEIEVSLCSIGLMMCFEPVTTVCNLQLHATASKTEPEREVALVATDTLHYVASYRFLEAGRARCTWTWCIMTFRTLPNLMTSSSNQHGSPEHHLHCKLCLYGVKDGETHSRRTRVRISTQRRSREGRTWGRYMISRRSFRGFRLRKRARIQGASIRIRCMQSVCRRTLRDSRRRMMRIQLQEFGSVMMIVIIVDGERFLISLGRRTGWGAQHFRQSGFKMQICNSFIR